MGCCPSSVSEDVSSQVACGGRRSEWGTVCEGRASHANVLTMLERGVNHHFVLPQGKRGVEDKCLRWDGRCDNVREGLNVPSGILRFGVDHLEHGENGILGVCAFRPGVGGG